ncbi:hypothetical protein C2G38_394232 [Gigaspora rosea]|uniref:Uncharacterized protein n=1 Tax=Gigaspora rosea TaxID=44941 RepID=A0A397W3C0_9GLOM|nr:hypothetical protein C2G38_394232 [Gigaspora rosea]
MNLIISSIGHIVLITVIIFVLSCVCCCCLKFIKMQVYTFQGCKITAILDIYRKLPSENSNKQARIYVSLKLNRFS